MNVTEAAELAKRHVIELFKEEKVSNVGLEEVEFDDDCWTITIGFSRPWDYPVFQNALFALQSQKPPPRRSFKIVKIRSADGQLVSVKNRLVPTVDE